MFGEVKEETRPMEGRRTNLWPIAKAPLPWNVLLFLSAAMAGVAEELKTSIPPRRLNCDTGCLDWSFTHLEPALDFWSSLSASIRLCTLAHLLETLRLPLKSLSHGMSPCVTDFSEAPAQLAVSRHLISLISQPEQSSMGPSNVEIMVYDNDETADRRLCISGLQYLTLHLLK